MKGDTRKVLENLDKSGNSEKFHADYFSLIVSKPAVYFPDLKHQMAMLLSMRLADNLLASYLESRTICTRSTKTIDKTRD